jgi:nickel/cobalt transporter (NicO) family protein
MADSLTLSSIFLLGCFHALEPGHGKTFLMAYTIGEKLDLRKSILLTLGIITSHFTVLSVIAVLFNIFIFDVIDQNFHEFSHWFGPSLITLFGAFILGRSIYKKNHSHSDDCGHQHGKIKDSRLESPISVGLLTGLLPCASSLAVVMMTGEIASVLSIIRFISIYVIGIAIVLFLIIMIFNYSKLIIKNQFQYFSKNINTEMFSGFMIILVGVVYFSYNLFEKVH